MGTVIKITKDTYRVDLTGYDEKVRKNMGLIERQGA